MTHPEDPFPTGRIALLGVPWDENSSHRRGAAGGPAKIRERLYGGASNLCTEAGLDLGDGRRLDDRGDIVPGGGTSAVRAIAKRASEILSTGERMLALGGDHAVTWPLVRACAERFGPLNILHMDAHPDLYESFDGNPLSHASPFARILEDGLARRVVQAGIRAHTPHQRRQAARYGVETVEMRSGARHWPPFDDGPLYLSIDLDVLDPAFAPGVSHPEPGGMSTRELIAVVQSLWPPPVGADIVELNPQRDPLDLTAAVAAKLVREVAGKMLEDEHRRPVDSDPSTHLPGTNETHATGAQ